MTHLATATPYDVPKKSYLTGSSSEPSFAEWAIGCLHRMVHLRIEPKRTAGS